MVQAILAGVIWLANNVLGRALLSAGLFFLVLEGVNEATGFMLEGLVSTLETRDPNNAALVYVLPFLSVFGIIRGLEIVFGAYISLVVLRASIPLISSVRV